MPNHILLTALMIIARALGSLVLDWQLRECGSSVHMFGHSHLNVNRVIDGVQYIQHPRGYGKSPTASTLKSVFGDYK